MSRMFVKIQKKVLDAALLKTQLYKVRIKGKVEQSKEWSCALTYTSVWQLLKTEPSGDPLRKVALFTFRISLLTISI